MLRSVMVRKPAREVPEQQVPQLSFEAAELVLRQRTRLLRLLSKEYFDTMAGEFATIRNHLPERLDSVLDIGGGLGGVHIFLNKTFGPGTTHHFLERDALDPRMLFGYRDVTEAYNSFSIAKAYLAEGGIPQERLIFWDADRRESLADLTKTDRQFDVVMSLKSWCFHYPYATYRDLARRLLAPTGRLIVDIRRDKGLEAEIETDFELVAVAVDGSNFRRLVVRQR